MFAETILGVAKLGITPSTYRPRPSLAGPERCLRQTVYRGRGVEEPPVSGRLAMIFRDGHTNEDTSLAFLQQSLFHIHGQQLAINILGALDWLTDAPVYRCPMCSEAAGTDVWILATTFHGHIDALATTVLGRTYLFEHKAVVSHFFRRYWEEEKEPLDYFTQIVSYFRGLHEEGLDITEGALVIKNKDTGAILEFELQYDYMEDRLTVTAILRAPGRERKTVNQTYQGLFTQAIDRFREAHRHITNQTLPGRLEDADDIRCQYCPFDDICWDDYQAPVLTERLIMPDRLKNEAEEYIALDRELAPKNKRHEELKDLLKQELEQLHVTEAIVGDKMLLLQRSTQTRTDEKRLPVILKTYFSKTIDILKLTIKSTIPSAHTTKKRKLPTVPRGPHSHAA